VIQGGNAVVSPTTTTSYTVTGTSSVGCAGSNTATATVTVFATPTIAVTSGSICNGQSFTIVPGGATGGTYAIQGGSFVVSPTTTANYTVTGTSSVGCVGSNTVTSTVTVNAIPVLTITSSNTTICTGKSSTLTAAGANTYTWLPSGNTNSISVSPTATAVYTVSGTSTAGCISNTVATTVSVNPLPTITISNGTICPAAIFTLTPGGALTYTYTNATTTLTGVTATTAPTASVSFTVSGTNVNGCVSTGTNNAVATISILASPALTVTASPTAICRGATASLTASGANTYTWTAPASNATLVTVNPTTTTVYTVTGTGSNVCNGVKLFTLTVNPTPTITINSGTICSGRSFTLSPSGAGTGGTYTLSGGGNVVSPLSLTNYSATGTSSLGCISNTSSPAVSTVAVIASPTISATGGSICAGSTFSILPTGADTYSLNGTSTSTTAPVSPAGTTVYSVTGTGTNNCISVSPAVITVSVIALPTLTATAASTAICIGQGTAVLSVSGANTYTWSSPTATTSTIAVSPTITSTYSVAGTETTGCTNTQTVSVFVNALPSVSISASSTFICVGQTATLTGLGANTYVWSNTGTANTTTVNPITNANYSVTGTSTAGCTNTASIAMTVNTINITVSANGTICPGTSTALVAGGAVTYTWNNSYPFDTFTVTPTAAAVYTVVAVDINNCVLSKTVSLDLYPVPNVTAALSSSLICLGETATITAGGVSSYTWSTGSSATSITVSPNADLVYNYSVAGTDANGCVGVANTTLTVSNCLGTKEITNSFDLSIYPNPANGQFNVQLDAVTGDQTIEVYDLVGQLVFKAPVTTTTTQVQLSHYAKGIYVVRITSKGSLIGQKKLSMQ
jgi:hypothetical protein